MARNAAASAAKWILTLAVLGGGGYYGWQWWNKKDSTAKPQFSTAKVERGDVVQAVTASGTLNPVINVQVGSQISGLLKKIHVDFNSKVKAGDLIAEIDPATYQARLEQNEADLASAKASLQLAEVNARRAEALYKEKLISQAEHDTTMAVLRQAEASVQTRQAQVNSTKVDLARCTIYAPIDGIVIDRKVDVGQTVAASLNAPVLFLIANDLTKMQINSAVAEADVGGVEVEQEAKFTVDAFPNRDFVGKVTQVRNSPTTVQSVVSYDTIIEVENADGKLKPGMTANVQIITSARKGVVRVANSAFRFRPPADTDAPKAATGTNAPAATSGEKIPATPEAMIARVKELRAKGESMSDEMQGKFREMIAAKQIDPAAVFGGGGGSGGPSGSGGKRGGSGGGKRGSSGGKERQSPNRTIYVVPSSINSTNLTVADMKAVTVKAGITDGIFTEILEGLQEGDSIVTGQVLTGGGAAKTTTNPFGSSFRR